MSDDYRQRDILKFRLESVLQVLSHQRSGADIHEVGEMRHIGGWLLDIVNENPMWAGSGVDFAKIEEMVLKLEKELTNFFLKKYHMFAN